MKITILPSFFCAVFILLGSLLYAQNNPCNNPKVVGSLPYSYSGSTCGNIGMQNLCGYSNKPGKGEIFRIDVPANVTCLKVNVTGMTGNLGDRHFVYLMDACPLTNPNAKCVYNNAFLGGSSTGNSPTQNMEVQPGQTYYYVLASQNLSQSGGEGQPPVTVNCGNFTIDIEEDTDCPVYANNCAMEEVDPLPFVSTNNTCNGKSLLNILEDEICLFSGFLTDGHEYAYHYRNDVEDICAKIKLTSLSGENMQVIMSNYCRYTALNGQKCLAYFPDSANYILEKGVDYYFYVTQGVSNSDCADFRFEVTGDPLVDMGCVEAYSVPTPTYYIDTNDYACQKYSNPFLPNCLIYEYKNFYEFDVTEKSCLRVGYKRLQGSFFDNREIQVYRGCPETAGSVCVNKEVFEYNNNREEDDAVYKFVLEPGKHYLVISEDNQSARYQMRFELNPYDAKYELGTCTTPYTNTDLNLRDTIYFDPCAPLGTIEQHREQCELPRKYGSEALTDASTKIIAFTAQKSTCYLFQVSDTAHLNTMTLFDRCPEDPNAICLSSAMAYFESYHDFRADLTDSLAFSYNMTAGETVYWVITGQAFPHETYSMPIKVTAVGEDDCFDCEEDICKACAGIATETSRITGWRMYTGDFNNPAQTEIQVGGAINQHPDVFESGRHIVTTAGSLDPYAPISVNNPFTGRYSIRLGNAKVGAEAEQMSFTYNVSPNSTFFTYYYAVVFEDPGHDPSEQPYFRVRVLTQDGSEIGCGVYEVSAGAGIPGFKKAINYDNIEEPLYKDWSAVSIPVSAYVGQDLTVEFITRDCARGDHYGYAYFDATCETLGNLEDEIILCQGDSVALIAPPGFETYTWDNGKTGQIIYTSVPGDFHVEMVTRTGCQFAQDAVVIQVDNPSISGVSYSQACDEAAIQFVQNNPNINPPADVDVYWVINHTDTIADSLDWKFESEPGRYHISFHYDVQDKCNFLWEDSIPIYPPLSTTSQLPDTFFCDFDSVLMKIPHQDLVTYLWSNGSTVDSSFYTTDGDQYLLRSSGVCNDSLPFHILRKNNYPFTLPNDTVLCNYDSLEIGTDATPNTSYLWNTGASTNKIMVKDSAWYRLTNVTDGCSNTDSIHISLYPYLDLNLPDDTSYCQGDNMTLGIVPGLTNVMWNTGATSDSILISSMGTFWVQASVGFCESSDTVVVIEQVRPTVDLGNDSILCETQNFTIQPSFTNTVNPVFTWEDGSNNIPRTVVNPSATYILYVQDGVCINSDTLHLEFIPQPNPTLPANHLICQLDSVLLNPNVSTAYQFQWNTGATLPSIWVKNSGTYQVDVSVGSCMATASSQVSLQNPPNIDLGLDLQVCEGETLRIGDTVSGAISYNWETGEISDSIEVFEENMYRLVAFDGVCTVEDSVYVTVFENPVVRRNSFAEMLCLDQSLLVDLFCENCLFQTNQQDAYTKYVQIGDSLVYYAITPDGCEERLQLLVGLDPNCKYEIYVPNAFSPDGDGLNEGFGPISSTRQFQDYEFHIFDRWGEILFHSVDISEKWDGKIDNTLVTPDTYVWQLRYTYKGEAHKVKHRGTVTVVR